MITTHVLDTARGRPASGVPVTLEHEQDGAWRAIGQGLTDSDGRLRTLAQGQELAGGTYRITFDTAAYFAAQGIKGFYPYVQVVFVIGAGEHYHVPLLLSPFGYSTYRGS